MVEKFNSGFAVKAILASFEELAGECDLAVDSSVLFTDRSKRALAKLKIFDEASYVRLLDRWKDERVPRLPDLRKAVDSTERGMRKRVTKARVVGDDGLVRDGYGKLILDRANIITALDKLGVRLRYDSFRGWPMVAGLPSGFGPSLDDAALNRMWLMLDEQFGFRPPQPLFNVVATDVCMRNAFHPVRDYLDDLVDYGVWDGVPRLDRWLIDYAGAKDAAYVRTVGALVLLAAVRRVRHPGTRFDEMLVLESAEQGYGKSTLVAALAVKEEWFSDSVPLNADDKRMIESTSGKWVNEVSELQGMRKGEVEKIRAQLSRPVDRARMAYARLPVEIPRQYILIGTTNATASAPYLADIDGNRRFWPVEVGRCDVAAFIRDRDMIWAEAALREAEGASIRLPETMWAEAGREQSARAVGNAFLEVLGPALGEREGIIMADDAWRLLSIPVERRDPHANKFGKAMKSLGWTRAQRRLRRGHDPVSCYVRGLSERRLVFEQGYGEKPSIRYAGEDMQSSTDDTL